MSEPTPPEWEDLWDMLRMIAQQEGGERFLNCVLQRFAARMNQLPLEHLAMAVHQRGSVTVVFAPNLERLLREYGLPIPNPPAKSDDPKDPKYRKALEEYRQALEEAVSKALLTRHSIKSYLGQDETAFTKLRTNVNRTLRKLATSAALKCAEAG